MLHASQPAILKVSGYFLVSIIGTIVAIYASLLWKADDVAHLGMSTLFGLAIGSLLWEKRHDFIAQSQAITVLFGSIIIIWGIIQPFMLNNPALLRLMPLICGMGLAMVASGFQRMRQYWKELTMLFFLMVPRLIVSAIYDLSPLTAKFSAFSLWYLGYDASLNGVHVILPTGAVEVYEGCSGLESMAYLLGLSVVCLLLYPLTRKHYGILVPFVAVALGFVINAGRVMLLTVMVAQGREAAFDYWHEGDGSLLFGMVGVLLLGAIYSFLLNQSDTPKQEFINKA